MQKILPGKSERPEILLENAIDFIGGEQNPDGSFTSISSPDFSGLVADITYKTTFQASLILGALAGPAKIYPKAQVVCHKAAGFLLDEKNENWSWNYWSRQSPEAKTMTYPDDLDDTFLALSALHVFDTKLVGPRGLAHAIRLLTAMEIMPGGPYRTWLTFEPNINFGDKKKPGHDHAPSHLDIAVNANIAYFLSLHSIVLPNLNALFEKAIEGEKIESRYYPSIYQTAYFISRSYHGKNAERLVKILDQAGRKKPETILALSLKLSTLIRLDAPNKKILAAFEDLTRRVALAATAGARRKKAWEAEPFCVDPARNPNRNPARDMTKDATKSVTEGVAENIANAGQKHYGGGTALTAAIAAEAIWLFISQNRSPGKNCRRQNYTYRYREHQGREPIGHGYQISPAVKRPIIKEQVTKESVLKKDAIGQHLRSRVIVDVKKLFSGLDPISRQKIHGVLDSILMADKKNELTLLPYFFAKSLWPEHYILEKRVLDRCRDLGVAGLCGWLAYSVIDDFLDDQCQRRTDPCLLVPALACLRELTSVYSSFPDQASRHRILFQKIFKDVMGRSDRAHDWEMRHCRFKVSDGRFAIPNKLDFGDLSVVAERSLGHALGSVALLLSHDRRLRPKKVRGALDFFKHYLIARQLNDDAHDWQEDLEAGRITPATNLLFQAWRNRVSQAAEKIDLAKSLSRLRETFWQDVMPTLCAEIIQHSETAIRKLRDLSLNQPEYFIDLVDRQKSAAEKALEERLFVKEFSSVKK